LMGRLSNLPQPLKTHVQKEALKAARNIEDESDRGLTLACLLPFVLDEFDNEELHDALEAVWDMRYEWLDRLGYDLESFLALTGSIQVSGNFKYDVRTAEMMRRLVEKRTEAELYAIWRESMRLVGTFTRSNFLAALRPLAPVLKALGGIEVVSEITRSIHAVRRWWA